MNTIQIFILLCCTKIAAMNNPIVLPNYVRLNSHSYSVKNGDIFSFGFSTKYELIKNNYHPHFDWEITNLKKFQNTLELLSIKIQNDSSLTNTLHKIWTFKALKSSDVTLIVKKIDFNKDEKIQFTNQENVVIIIK